MGGIFNRMVVASSRTGRISLCDRPVHAKALGAVPLACHRTRLVRMVVGISCPRRGVWMATCDTTRFRHISTAWVDVACRLHRG